MACLLYTIERTPVHAARIRRATLASRTLRSPDFSWLKFPALEVLPRLRAQQNAQCWHYKHVSANHKSWNGAVSDKSELTARPCRLRLSSRVTGKDRVAYKVYLSPRSDWDQQQPFVQIATANRTVPKIAAQPLQRTTFDSAPLSVECPVYYGLCASVATVSSR